jgi:hypothetical protein
MKVNVFENNAHLSLFSVFVFFAILRLAVDNAEHLSLERFLVLAEAVLLPCVVEELSVEVMPNHAILEETNHSLVIGLLFELERSAQLHELFEFIRLSLAEVGERRLNLLLLDRRVLFVLGAARKSLPRQGALKEVEEHMPDGLKVVASALLDALVGGDGGVAGSSRQVLAILVGDVFTLAVAEAFGQTKVDNVNGVLGRFSGANEEVIRLYVPVDDSLFVHLLDALNHLDGDHEARLKVERALACLEKILQRRSQHIHYHNME